MDPANEEIIQRVYKKSIRADEERLMLAVLESAVEDFQKYVLVRNPRGKQRFQQAEGWFLKDGEASQAGEQSHRATAHRTEAVWLSSKEL